MEDYIGSIMGLMKGDTRSLDYSSSECCFHQGFSSISLEQCETNAMRVCSSERRGIDSGVEHT